MDVDHGRGGGDAARRDEAHRRQMPFWQKIKISLIGGRKLVPVMDAYLGIMGLLPQRPEQARERAWRPGVEAAAGSDRSV